VIIAITCLVAIAVIAFILGVRPKDLPVPEPESPFQHLDDRKAAIYENLRDLQFEYRLGKLSDADYQSTKRDLQKELAQVLAEVDRLQGELGVAVKAVAAAAPPAKPSQRAATVRERAFICDGCGAKFAQDLKFCGECGKPMKVAQ
jgi:rRNA maturation endonuclease Nob1